MRLMITGATTAVKKFSTVYPDYLGLLPVPRAGNKPEALAAIGLPIAADNGCYNGLDSALFTRMLVRYSEAQVALEWVTVPDALGDARATISLWDEWAAVVLSFGFRPAFVLQDGLTLDQLRRVDPPAVFVGGSTKYKMSRDATAAVKWARSQGRPAHMGRVNSLARIRHAVLIGCTSVDGSGYSKWPDQKIPKAVLCIRRTIAASRSGFFPLRSRE